MKNKILYWVIPAMLLIAVSASNAQSLQQNVGGVSSGASVVNGSGHSGNVTIGTIWLAHDSTLSSVASQKDRSILEQVYPNPSTGEFTIIPADGSGDVSQIELLDEAGHAVADLTHSAMRDASGIHITSRGLAAGSYFVRVKAHGGEYFYKVVMNHNGP
ncbi:MAG: T9SS type A sorting domain-containing protein [Candidatus Kapaibacterium sp.]